MKINMIVAALAVSLLGSSCNSALEERIDALENRVAELETPSSTPIQPASFEEADNSLLETAPTNGAAPTFSFKEETYDFGDITQGDVVEHVFTFTNTGDAPLVIQDAKASCGCTIPKKPEQPVAPGETSEIGVKFNSTGKSGVVKKAITITANTNPAVTQLYITANIAPQALKAVGPLRKK